MFQWGRYSLAAPTGSSVAVNFPIPFGTVLHAWTGVDGASSDQIGTQGITTSAMTVSKGSADTAARTGSWFAIGGAF
ncbi:gp53-like domain-containing protein [Pseudomonas sp.]|uniref:gp53-like domain-containing protein n=1 Tax=Pseudomonas sp. TaxID=306 RepID=UPI003FD809E3